jgi:methylmalonyl-CoA/ethylmalonyl-CoA epimerase
LHHVCFEVDGIADKLKTLQELGIDLLDKAPRKGLMGGDIGFMDPSSAQGVLIELAQHSH